VGAVDVELTEDDLKLIDETASKLTLKERAFRKPRSR
jgi:hypothetical protein